MSGFKKRFLVSIAAATLVTAWVDPRPSVDGRATGPAENLDRLDRKASSALPSVPSDFPARASPSHPETASSADPADALGAAAETALDRWLGLDEHALRVALGPPMRQEDRPPAKLSSFRDQNCTLNVTLNPDVETREFHALDYKVISDAHTAKRTRECALEFSARFSQR
jgi:hypothetical protein